ncbi:hypothetical protein AAES_166439 [Amazona aestiva]|uniref:Uncharacterized protein n=1 Tax=Amazona aestiva TaxID=12930 RepID=A0A0Q3PBA2_AMAAE|nr:hypothetical protein AAES_166439 [Amazona aestiva]
MKDTVLQPQATKQPLKPGLRLRLLWPARNGLAKMQTATSQNRKEPALDPKGLLSLLSISHNFQYKDPLLILLWELQALQRSLDARQVEQEPEESSGSPLEFRHPREELRELIQGN